MKEGRPNYDWDNQNQWTPEWWEKYYAKLVQTKKLKEEEFLKGPSHVPLYPHYEDLKKELQAKIKKEEDYWPGYKPREASKVKEKEMIRIPSSAPKAFLFVYSNQADGDIVIERLTSQEISKKVRELELSKGEFAIIDGKVVKNVG